jgi:hypothetical protein
MPKVKISEFSATPSNNTDIDGINIAEGCAPSGINDAIRELMSQLKDFQTGAVGDSFNGPVGTSTAAAGAFTTLSASSTVSGTGFSTYLASPPAIGGTAPAAGAFTTLSATGVTTVQAGSAGAPAITTTGDTNTGIFFPAADTIAFSEGGVEAMRLNASGSLGLGVTPSDWQVAVPAFESTLGIYSGRTESNLTTNAYFNSSFKYIGTGLATQYQQQSGQHRWFTAASGTAGNAISFTQAMTLNASGNLLLGTASDSVFGRNIVLDGVGSCGLSFRVSTSQKGFIYADANDLQIGANTGAIIFKPADTERARIDSSGNLGIGTTSPVYKLVVSAAGASGIEFGPAFSGSANLIQSYNRSASAYVNTVYDAAAHVYNVSGSERARITSGGDLLLGTTTSSFTSKQEIVQSTANPVALLYKSNTNTGAALNIWHGGATGAATATQIAFLRADSTTVGSITSTTSATAYVTSSDYRLKNTIAPMTGALAKVALLKPCTYKWNIDGSNGEGFIAHELAEVMPQCVVGEKDAVDDKGKPQYQGIDTSFLVATLTAAIQELKAEFDAYKATHP